MQLKKTALRLLPLMLVFTVLFAAPCVAAESGLQEAQSETDTVSIPDDTLITYGYLETLKKQLKEEIIRELMKNGGLEITGAAYTDISAQEGQFLILSADSEVIYRGGGAVVITSSPNEGDGIIDMSEGRECFSGASLEYGHIYFASPSESEKCILVTGKTAYFTVRGGYELG